MAGLELKFGRPLPPPEEAEEPATPVPQVREDIDVAILAPDESGVDARDLIQQMMRTSLAFFASEVVRGHVTGLAAKEGAQSDPASGTTIIGEHHQEWDEIVRRHKQFCIIAPRDHGKSHLLTIAYPIWEGWRRPGCVIAIFSETQPQAEEQLAKLKAEIESNPRLSHLMDPACWSATKIRFTNGSTIYARGFGVKTRGMHPHLIICDDVVSEAAMYSALIRERQDNYFLGAIRNMLVPDGTLAVVGCITPDSWVTTEGGLRQIGSLCPGPMVPQTLYDLELPILGRRGVRPTSKFWVNGRCATKRITLERGYRIEGSHRHPLLVMGANGEPSWRRSDEIQVGDWVGLHCGADLWGSPADLLPLRAKQAAEPKKRNQLLLPDTMVPDLAYLLGLWTAEGSFEASGRVNISNLGHSIREWLESSPFGLRFQPNTSEGCQQTERCSSKSFLELVEFVGGHLGKAPTKTVPPGIMGGDRESARAFLQGLYDGDGCVHVQNGNAQVSLTSTSEELVRRTQTLLLNCGIVATISKTPPRASERVRHPTFDAWSLRATGEDARLFLRDIGFRLPRKQAAVQALKVGESRDTSRDIPHQGVVIAGIRREKPRRPRGQIPTPAPGNFTETAKASCPLSAQLSRVAEWFDANGSEGPATSLLRSNLEESARGRVWLRVASVEDSESDTVDFVVPDGHSFVANGIVNHNTPQHADDLYGKLEKNAEWFFKRYQAIDKTGRILFPERYSAPRLAARRREIGEIRFSREFLGVPTHSGMSIFPDEFVTGEPFLDSTVSLGQYLTDGSPARIWWEARGVDRFFAGVDVATSANVGADYFVVFVVGLDAFGRRWVVDIFREKGMKYTAQKAKIKEKGQIWRCECVCIESNAAQSIWGDQIKDETDIPIFKHQTGSDKHSLEKGIPSMRVLFENQKYRCPRGDDDSKIATDEWIGELQSWTFANGQVVSVAKHDDLAMAQWHCELAIARGQAFSFAFGAQAGDEEAARAEEAEESALLDAAVQAGLEPWVMMGLEDVDMGPVPGRRADLASPVPARHVGEVRPKHPLGDKIPLWGQVRGKQ